MAGLSDNKEGKGKRKAPKPPPKPKRSDFDKRSLLSRDGAATVSEKYSIVNLHFVFYIIYQTDSFSNSSVVKYRIISQVSVS